MKSKRLLWNPEIQRGDPSFGVRTDRFGFNITGTPNIPLVVEAGTDLGDGAWVPLQTNVLAGSVLYFSDRDWTNRPARFYRIRSP